MCQQTALARTRKLRSPVNGALYGMNEYLKLFLQYLIIYPIYNIVGAALENQRGQILTSDIKT